MLSSCFELGVDIAIIEVDAIGEQHGVAESGKRLRLALPDGFLKDAECSMNPLAQGLARDVARGATIL